MTRRVPTTHARPESSGGRYAAEHGIDAYRREYTRGWNASLHSDHPREWENGTSTDAYDDGYLDAAAGREKWHLTRCATHDTTC